MVLYLGRVVEQASVEDLYRQPRHPYTKALMSAAPIPDPVRERSRQRIRLKGETPSVMDPLAGLRFMPSRLPVDPLADVYVPQLREIASGHLVAEFDEGHV
jgi:oligopeptide/dipeptide ABC transporter ATP-binding protein